MKNEIKTITLGCRLNSYESDIIKSYKNNSINKNIVVINTCAVTAEAERQGRQQARKARKNYPEAYIMATGCAVELDKKAWNNMSEVDKIIPNKNKLAPSLWGLQPEINNKLAIKEDASHLQSIRGHKEKTRAFIRIQNGCNHSCTFCIITEARGDSISVPSGSIISEIRKTISAGIQEIILTGVDLTSYGAAEIDNDLMEAFETEKRLMPHLHLSLQSHDNLILKRMKRRHSSKDAEKLISRLKEIRPNILFGADLIAGFPTESELAFRNTLNSIEKLNLTFLHVFPYSSRPETPAARMPQIPLKEIKKRAKFLRESGDIQLKKELKKSINTFHNVLVETATGVGHSENFLTVKVKDATERKIYKCKITGIENNMLIGDIHESI